LRLGVRTKLFLISFGLIVVTGIVSYYYLRSTLTDRLVERVSSDLTVRAELVASRVEATDLPERDIRSWDGLAGELGKLSGARVTLMALDGSVLGDSDVATEAIERVQNHAMRPEVLEAKANGSGVARRFSTTVGREMLYVARRLDHGDPDGIAVARTALPLVEVDKAVAALRSTLTVAALLALAVALVMSSLAAQLASRGARALTAAARRMARGDLDTRVRHAGTDEFAELGAALDSLAENLSNTLADLKSERDRLSGILSGMQEGVLFLDHSGRVVLVNPALREMLLLGSEAIGKTLLELVRHAELKDLLDEAQRSRKTLTREIEIGGLKPRRLLVRASQLEGAESGVVAVFVDVTEMRRLESMRRDFVANVSHELRTPVTAIRSAAETLESALADDPSAAAQFVAIIDRNAERLRGLVEDLLDLSRIESREYRLQLEALDLNQVFFHVVSLFSDRADKKRMRLGHDTPPGTTWVRADRRALEHVLTNLIDNAVKYCPEGARIRLTAEAGSESVRVLVEDSGQGIEPRHLPRLFERFYRVDAGRSRELGGTGLGLSIVKHLVESMGGNVSVESTPGKGTVFSFTLLKGQAMSSVPPPALQRTA
jgi:two-component system phosphate regulon sensor histidine kinase PhoR